MSAKNYLTASDVSEYMGISIPMAYKIIRRLNDELKSNGYCSFVFSNRTVVTPIRCASA